MNWLNYLTDHAGNESEVRVYTMASSPGFEKYTSSAPHIKIDRSGNSNGRNVIFRFWKYIGFYASVTGKLYAWKPDTVMYYETLSAFPALIYKKWMRQKTRLIIHYHEYTSVREYREGMQMNRWGHLMERKLYS